MSIQNITSDLSVEQGNMEQYQVFFRKNDQNKETYFACFVGKIEAKIKPFYAKMIRKKFLLAVKVSSNLKKLAVRTWRFLMDTPIYICM
jgi:hypothetical protein